MKACDIKEHAADVCPGCSRHCKAGRPRCKYGIRYFEKMHKHQAEYSKPRYKWEKHVQPDGLLHHLLLRSKRIKRALRRKEVTERQLLLALSEAEQAQLDALLKKLSDCLG